MPGKKLKKKNNYQTREYRFFSKNQNKQNDERNTIFNRFYYFGGKEKIKKINTSNLPPTEQFMPRHGSHGVSR